MQSVALNVPQTKRNPAPPISNST